MHIFKNTSCMFTKRSLSLSLTKYQENHQNWPATASQALVIYQKKSLEFMKDKIARTQSWYEEFTGLRELREAQFEVVCATKKMKEAQERRRDARFPLLDIQKKLQDIQPELRNIARDDDRYIQLIKQEHALLKELKGLQVLFQEAENDERDAFELLNTSLRTSHEAERIQAEKTKYWSIIASIIGTTIGVIGTTWNNRKKMKELKDLVATNNYSQVLHEIENKMADKKDIEKIYNKLNIVQNNFDTFSEVNLKHVLVKDSSTSTRDLPPSGAEMAAFGVVCGVVVYGIYSFLFK